MTHLKYPPVRLPSEAPLRRVAFIVHEFPVLSEVFIMHAAVGLARRGWRVDIIPTLQQAEPGDDQHEVEREFRTLGRVIEPRGGGAVDRALAAPAALAGLVRQHGGWALRSLDPTLHARETLSLRPIFLAEALSEGGPYDIIHCQFGTLAKRILALRASGVIHSRILVHFRGYDITSFVARKGGYIYDQTFEEADWFLANCRHFRNRAIEIGCDANRIDVVPSGCDVSRFPFHERRPPTGGPVRLLAIGRLIEKKGFDLAIGAVERLRAEGRDVRLRIIGDGALREALGAQAEAGGIADAVDFLGSRAHEEVANELAAAHILVAPSVTAPNGDQDAAVNTLKEAMASGVPVVASRHGGIPELIVDGVNGMLCREGDAGDLAARIAALLDAPALWAPYGRAARRTVLEEHSLDVATDKLIAVYENVLGVGPASHQEEKSWPPHEVAIPG